MGLLELTDVWRNKHTAGRVQVLLAAREAGSSVTPTTLITLPCESVALQPSSV